MREVNDIWYTLKDWSGELIDTSNLDDAKTAFQEGREVVKNTRKLFYSGPSTIRLTVATEIRKAKDLKVVEEHLDDLDSRNKKKKGK